MEIKRFKVGIMMSYNDFATVGNVSTRVEATSPEEASRKAEKDYLRRYPTACILVEKVKEQS